MEIAKGYRTSAPYIYERLDYIEMSRNILRLRFTAVWMGEISGMVHAVDGFVSKGGPEISVPHVRESRRHFV